MGEGASLDDQSLGSSDQSSSVKLSDDIHNNLDLIDLICTFFVSGYVCIFMYVLMHVCGCGG